MTPKTVASALFFLAVASVAEPAELRPAQVWVYDGDDHTYFTIRPIVGPRDLVLSVEGPFPGSWNASIGYLRARLANVEHAVPLTVVGHVPAETLPSLISLGDGEERRVVVEPDPEQLLRRSLARDKRELVPMWLPDSIQIAMAASVAAGLSTPQRLYLPVTKPDRLRWLLDTGRVREVVELGASLPIPATERARLNVQRLDGGWAGLFSLLDRRSGDAPVEYTLAVYTGYELLDGDPFVPGTEQPLSFYKSADIANDLCTGRELTCLPYSVSSAVAAHFDPLLGWVGNVDVAIDEAIAAHVTQFNQTHLNQITKLAIVGHPLDIPYRRFMFGEPDEPETPGYVLCTNLGSDPSFPNQQVDYGTTDNTDPRNGNCQPGIDAEGRLDFSPSGSADFEYANVSSALGAPTADLAYGRIAGQDHAGALMHVASIKCALGIGAICPSAPPRGAISHAPNHALASLFADYYEVPAETACPAPMSPLDQLVCPSHHCGWYMHDESSYGMGPTYDMGPDWLGHLTDDGPEVVVLFGHQTTMAEPIVNRHPLHGSEHYRELCSNPGANDGCDENPTWIDRQRVQFDKGCRFNTLCGSSPPACNDQPDVDAPAFTTEYLRYRQQNTDPNDDFPLNHGYWFIEGSDVGYYNYLDHWAPVHDYWLPPPVVTEETRLRRLGADSSFLSTLIPGGVAGIVVHLPLFEAIDTSGPVQRRIYSDFRDGVYYPTVWRRLSQGLTFGEAIRLTANEAADENRTLVGEEFFRMNSYFLGDPDLSLHRPVATPLDEDRIVLMVAPGPGASLSDNPNRVMGYNQDGAHLGLPNFIPEPREARGANIATGELVNDGSADEEVLVGTGNQPMGGTPPEPRLRGYKWDGTQLPGLDFFPYGGTTCADAPNGWGMSIATSDILNAWGQWNPDGKDEILVAPGVNDPFAPLVRGFRYDGASVQCATKVNFVPYVGTIYGAHIAGGQAWPQTANGDLVTGRGPGPGYGAFAKVWTFSGTGPTMVSQSTILPTMYGVHVAVGDVATDDGEEMLFGAGPGPSNVGEYKVHKAGAFLGQGVLLHQTQGYGGYMGYPDMGRYGTRVATANFDSEPLDEIVLTRGADPLTAPEGDTLRDYVPNRVVVRDCCTGSLVLDFNVGARNPKFGMIVAGIHLESTP